MAAKQKEISLLPEEKTGLQSTLEKAFDWLVNTGRWIIVFTELIVILAFLSRFWLDQRLADIYAKNIQKITIIEAAFEHSPIAGTAALIGAGITAFYMTRLMLMTFLGEEWRKLGMITPLGGLAFIIGWIAVAIAAWRS